MSGAGRPTWSPPETARWGLSPGHGYLPGKPHPRGLFVRWVLLDGILPPGRANTPHGGRTACLSWLEASGGDRIVGDKLVEPS